VVRAPSRTLAGCYLPLHKPYLRKVPDVTTLLEILEKPPPWRSSVICVGLTCAHTSSITLFEGLVQIAYACRHGKE
jgi:hypothetical protein